MSWSYDVSALATNAVFRVRALIGDVQSTDPQMQDEEIQALIDVSFTDQAAAMLAARTLAARYARYVDKWVGDLKILASQRHRNYLDLVEELKTAGIGSAFLGIPSAGGIRVSQKQGQEQDSDLVVPSFKRDMHDNPGID